MAVGVPSPKLATFGSLKGQRHLRWVDDGCGTNDIHQEGWNVKGTRTPMEAGLIARLLEQTARAIYEDRGPRAIHPGQWAILRYLSGAARTERTVGHVALFLGVTHAPASRAVASLARKNFIRVETDPSDRRVRRIDLTTSGRNLLNRDPMLRLARAIEELSQKERDMLSRLLGAMHSRLSGEA